MSIDPSSSGVSLDDELPTTSHNAILTAEKNSSNTTTPQARDKAAANDQAENKTFSRYRSLVLTECSFASTTSENVRKRMQNLRKELDYINETNWMFEGCSPLEKKQMQ